MRYRLRCEKKELHAQPPLLQNLFRHNPNDFTDPHKKLSGSGLKYHMVRFNINNASRQSPACGFKQNISSDHRPQRFNHVRIYRMDHYRLRHMRHLMMHWIVIQQNYLPIVYTAFYANAYKRCGLLPITPNSIHDEPYSASMPAFPSFI